MRDFIPDNAVVTLIGMVRALQVRVTTSTISQTLLSHPDYPSMLALSDALTEWQVDNMAVSLDTTQKLYELPMPFVAHLKREGGWYVLVKGLKGDFITYNDSEQGTITESLNKFEKQWTGVVLLAEPNEHSGAVNYDNKRKKQLLNQIRVPVLLVGALLILFLALLETGKHFTSLDWLLLLTKSLGLSACVFLVGKTLGSKNKLIDQLCSLHSKTHCNSILNAPAAKLWGWVSWSDIGLVYFAGGILSVLLIPAVPSIRMLLSWMTLLALPYVIFSIYYQAVVAKQWCVLCLFVQFVLLAEAGITMAYSLILPNRWQPYSTVVIAFLTPTLLWTLLKPLLESQKKSELYYTRFMKLWRDPKLFRTTLRQQPRIPTVTNDMHPILLGIPSASHTILMVTNPYCNPCARKYKELQELVESEPDINAQIIFSLDGINGKKTKVALHTMTLDQNGMGQSALTNWFNREDADFEHWAKEYPVKGLLTSPESILERNQKWLDAAQIDVTPALFIDGYKLPSQYQVNLKRLRWLIKSETTTLITNSLEFHKV